MDEFNYKKISLATQRIARELYNTTVPTRIETVSEYSERFGVSRGIIQKAFTRLQKDDCITVEPHGRQGSFLVEKDDAKLYAFTNWNVITGTMPAPIVPALSGLATAICGSMNESPIPFSFAFISGAQRRIDTLLTQLYDFTIVSRLSANHYVQQHPELQITMDLSPAQYTSNPFCLLLRGKNRSEIQDGMRVIVDPHCHDQLFFTDQLCRDKAVTRMEEAFIGIEYRIHKRDFDAIVLRDEDWLEELDNVSIIPLGHKSDSMAPVIVTHKNNHSMDQLLTNLIEKERIAGVQTEVIADPLKRRFY